MTKPIEGSWFEFQHHNKAEGVYWSGACAGFTEQDWDLKVREISGLGFKYLIIMAVALDNQTYYDSAIFGKAQLGCDDPIEAVLKAGNNYGVKFFMGNGFFGDWASHGIITDRDAAKRRLQAMGELAQRYGHHDSFYGWYWPNEAQINPYYSDEFIRYVNECSAEADKLTPGKQRMIAPYGTRLAKTDDKYVRQLDEMDIDIIAYQDEVGVRKSGPEDLAALYEQLRRAHDKVPEVALWADVEVFEFEGEAYKSALIPAEFSRVEKQLEAVSPFVDTILIYQYQGMMNQPGTNVFAGHPDSTRLYADYRQWLVKNHPDMLKS